MSTRIRPTSESLSCYTIFKNDDGSKGLISSPSTFEYDTKVPDNEFIDEVTNLIDEFLSSDEDASFESITIPTDDGTSKVLIIKEEHPRKISTALISNYAPIMITIGGDVVEDQYNDDYIKKSILTHVMSSLLQ